MGDEQHRLAVGVPQLQQQIAHDLSRLRIERPERLVHQQDLRVADQHLGEADAFALAARQHVRIAAGEGPEPDRGQPALRALQRLSARRALDLQPDGDVVDRGLPGKQRIGLKQVAGLLVEAGQRLFEDAHVPDDGLSSPAATLSNVDFPQPVGPTMATNSPCSTVRLACSTAV